MLNNVYGLIRFREKTPPKQQDYGPHRLTVISIASFNQTEKASALQLCTRILQGSYRDPDNFTSLISCRLVEVEQVTFRLSVMHLQF